MATAKTAPRAAKSATEAFETFSTASSDTVRENIDRSMAALSEASAFGKQNIEAFLASAQAAQKGFEALSARTVAFQKAALENHVNATKSLMTSTSVQEFVEKQNDYAKGAFEAYVAELTSVSELVTGVAKDALAPINDRVNAVGQFIQNGAAR
ncbi:MAG TPA: TIGR01841 family phasin [Vitreimonas sp.]|uniref:phasin family protein n=1 Tax=Vitreimonas sp. TaxID=3069702 RepID=UPI002D4108EC|nr:TIGR01841 family phasin [Vitreimonas sp.]HYD87935.1 TIGR01841 family phasin [Vitreimonas sp.]